MLQVLGVNIRQDSEGRYSLNDLHKASGNLARFKPSLFFARTDTKEFIIELNADNPAFNYFVRKQGRNGGSWISRLLVYEYASWISAKFRKGVFQAFDSMHNIESSTMADVDKIIGRFEADAAVASRCASGLSQWKGLKKRHQNEVRRAAESCQLQLKFTD